MPRTAIRRTAPGSFGASAFARNRPARLSAGFWIAVTLGVVMIIWSALLLLVPDAVSKASAEAADAADKGDVQAAVG